jgi:tetratricopeptide (TPR) repeat protein
MAFSGDLESFSLTDVFQKVQQNSDTGMLLVDDGKQPFNIFFKDGKVRGVSAVSGDDAFLLGILEKRSQIPEEKLKKILRRKSKDGHIAAAHRAGALTDSGVKELLTFYSGERIYDLFSIDQGEFTFEEGEGPLESIDPLQKKFEVLLEPGKLLFEAARRSDEWKRIKNKILSSKEVFTVNERKQDAIEDGDKEEKGVFKLLDGQRTVADVVALSPESRFTVFKALASLIGKNIVRPLSAGDATTVAMKLLREGRYTEAIRVGRKGLETERSNKDLRRTVAEALAKKGEKAKAAGELKLLAFSFVDGGNASAAEKIYREVLDLDPRDFDARERLFEIVADEGSLTKALKEGHEYASAAKKYGALDRAQDVLGRLTILAPSNPDILASLADIQERSGNRDEATQLLKRAARILYEDGQFTKAKEFYSRIVFLDPDDADSKRRLDEIKTGQAAKKIRFRKVLIRIIVIGTFFSLILAWIVYDWVSHMGYTSLTGDVVTLASEAKFLEAEQRCREFQEGHPLTLAGWRAGQLAGKFKALEEKAEGKTGDEPEKKGEGDS